MNRCLGSRDKHRLYLIAFDLFFFPAILVGSQSTSWSAKSCVRVEPDPNSAGRKFRRPVLRSYGGTPSRATSLYVNLIMHEDVHRHGQ